MFFPLVLVAIASASCSASVVNVNNVDPRRDVDGQILNAHSGSLYRFNGTFYLFGTRYPNCTQPGPICTTACGYFDNRFAVYSSPDLSTWTMLSDNLVPAINADSASIEYDEVNVGYCPVRGDYVMIFWSGHYGFQSGHIALARSATVAGPFQLAPPLVAAGATVISDTVSLFVDLDGTAYVRYNTRDLPYRHVVERLTPDWSATSGSYAVIFEKQDFPWYDGGGMFRRGDLYYVMLSFDCCFCQWGSDALVFVAPNPLGPWAPQSPSALRAARAMVAARGGAGCDLTGDWLGSLGGGPIGPPIVHLDHDMSTNVVRTSGPVATSGTFFPGNGSLVFPDFPGTGGVPLVGALGPFRSNESDPCSKISWLPPYQPPGSFWCRGCGPSPVPPANWSNEVNFCADGRQPPSHVPDMTVNPCSQDNVMGVNFTIPAQQFAVATLANASGGPPALLYFGERFRSTPTGNKSDDFMYWGLLEFDPVSAALLPMKFTDTFTMIL